MGTRIQDKSRTPKRTQAAMTFDEFDDSITYTGGKLPRADKRGFPLYEGVDTTRVAVTIVDTTP